MPDNNPEILSPQATEDAKLQVLLWLGGTFSNSLTDYTSTDDKGMNRSAFTAAAKFTSPITMQSLSFREEARYVQQENDQQYHYYGLYSINTENPLTGIEQEYFSYQLESSKSSVKERFTKQIAISGNRFTQERLYTMQFPAYPITSDTPQWIRDALNSVPENKLVGIGKSQHPSVDAMNLMTATRAATQIAWQVNRQVRDMVRDYTAASEVDPDAAISFQEVMTVAVTAMLVSAIKAYHYDLQVYDTDWQLWESAKAQKIQQGSEMDATEAERRMNETLEKYRKGRGS